MPAESTDPDVTNDVEHQRFVLHLDGEIAGIAEYETRPGRIVFTHTEVDPKFEGKGVGGRLAKAALDDARAHDLRVVPRCPFIAGWIGRHPDYADLVEPAP